MKRFVIVGGGPAAHQAAVGIVRREPQAAVTMVSSEAVRPYDRTQLSKGFLTQAQLEPPWLGNQHLYGEAQVTHVSGRIVEAVDRQRGCVTLDDGQRLDYDRLILATGSRLRRLPATMARAPVHYLRTYHDAQALKIQFARQGHVVIIGGGFIGLEVAAAARQNHCQVTVLEAHPQLLGRAGCPELGLWAARLHASQGVELRLGVSLLGIEPTPDGRCAVHTTDGMLLADTVVAGIGVMPNVELASDCGLAVEDGIVVDSTCATSDSNVFAAGEVTRYPVERLGVSTRSESWTAASEQGAAAGLAAAGDETAVYTQMPWLWSDQYGSSLQCLGIAELARKHAFLGDVRSDQWLALGWSDDDRLVCAIAANRPRDIAAIRRGMKRSEPLAEPYAAALADARDLAIDPRSERSLV